MIHAGFSGEAIRKSLPGRHFCIPDHLRCINTRESASLLTAMQVDFLPAAAMSEEDLERQRQVAAELAKRTRWVDFEFDGQPSQVAPWTAPRRPLNLLCCHLAEMKCADDRTYPPKPVAGLQCASRRPVHSSVSLCFQSLHHWGECRVCQESVQLKT